MNSAALYLLIKKDISAVEKQITTSLQEKATKSSKDIIHYILNSKGKLIRPILVLLSAYSHQDKIDDSYRTHIIKISAAIELIHMASLIHDDVIDHAPVRHNQPSIDAKWGKEVAIPMGVYLYSISLNLIFK